MTDSLVQTESKAIDEVAARYRREGYRVFTGASAAKALGSVGSSFVPDLVARKPNKTVIVEVKKQADQISEGQLSELKRIIERNPRWTLDVVYLPDERRRAAKPPSVRASKRALEEAADLFKKGHGAAGFLQAYAAVEAIAMNRITKMDPKVELPVLAATWPKTLAFLGLIRDSQYESLVNVRALRNEIAHGGINRKVPVRVMRQLVKIGQSLVRSPRG